MRPDPAPQPIVVDDAVSFQAASGATKAQMADLAVFRDLLADWNQRMNLVGPATIDSFWNRHAWDSAQLLTVVPPAKTWADLGAGAGLPGVVLAIMLKGVPGARVHLVESMMKRCVFLRAVSEALELPVEVHNARAESLNLKVDVVTARACAPMSKLLGFSWPYIRKGATAWFLKGQDVASELDDATKYWDFDADLRTSLSDPRGQIVQVKRLARVR